MFILHNQKERPITLIASQIKKKEILETLKAMKKNASPGPERFNVEFYLAPWEYIGDDITKVVRDFYIQGMFSKHMNGTHIVLITKKLAPHILQDFMPIRLCNVIY